MNYTMVIADDEPIVLKSEELFLRKEFPEVEIVGVAENGVILKEMIQRLKPDMALVDIRMPGLSGIEVVELLRNKGCPTHFIINTAYSDFEYVKKALDLKMDGYLLKPARTEEKKEIIRRLCQTVSEERRECLRKSGLQSALGVVNSVLGSEILMSVFSETYDVEGFEAYCNINDVHFHGGCIATFLPRNRMEFSKRQLSDQLEKCLNGICDFLATVTSRGLVVMFFVPEELEKKRQFHWCEELSKLTAGYLSEKTKTEYLYGTGKVYSSFADMRKSYEDSTQMLKRSDPRAQRIPIDSADKVQAYVEKTKEYLDIWFRKDISLIDCADSVGISPYYLSHIFKERTGWTFVEYLSRLRIEEAKRLCTQTELTVNEIAEQCGYVNITYFCKVFKKIEGMTIREYRKSRKAT